MSFFVFWRGQPDSGLVSLACFFFEFFFEFCFLCWKGGGEEGGGRRGGREGGIEKMTWSVIRIHPGRYIRCILEDLDGKIEISGR